jgi:hypothetical protein
MRVKCVPPHLRRGNSIDQNPVACAHRLISKQASGILFLRHLQKKQSATRGSGSQNDFRKWNAVFQQSPGFSGLPTPVPVSM